MLQFPDELKIPGLKLLGTESADEFAPPEFIKKTVSKWNPSARFEIIDGVDHFFGGSMELLGAALNSNI